MTKTPIALTLKGLTTALATLGTKEMAPTALVINDLFKILSSRTSGILRKRFFLDIETCTAIFVIPLLYTPDVCGRGSKNLDF